MAEIASVIVNGGEDYRTEAAGAFETRLAWLGEVVGLLARSHPEVATVLFPAGYFCTARHTQVSEVADRVAGRVAELNPPFMVVWGIDGWTEEAKQNLQCEEEGYPFYAFAKRAGADEPSSFRQTAITAEEGRSEAVEGRWAGRSVTVHGTSHALLICGECWSDWMLDRVRAARPSVLLIPPHRKVNLMDESGAAGHGRVSTCGFKGSVRRRGYPSSLPSTPVLRGVTPTRGAGGGRQTLKCPTCSQVM